MSMISPVVKLGSLQAQMLLVFEEGGWTIDELSEATGRPDSSCSDLVRTLVHKGLLKGTEVKRRSRYGVDQTVYIRTETDPEWRA